MTPTELADWLIEHGLAEEERGYGHPSGEDMAVSLLATFNIEWSVETDRLTGDCLQGEHLLCGWGADCTCTCHDVMQGADTC